MDSDLNNLIITFILFQSVCTVLLGYQMRRFSDVSADCDRSFFDWVKAFSSRFLEMEKNILERLDKMKK